ncbi:nucleotide pyrophosphohydrolase [Flavihumibacter petaseus]|uniref:Putative nucleotide pyrophosphatase n=1 Tax=Flavihumibacter petaseus NBRC 106054 TaxID=1220578 RepID=A0A0E9MXH9_9BACT|nr:nucleotide pyrophosphohydrolase [Flavihumibacter petaseus]GAO42319.1 putative nucleotide pyrophosphatase [Flavihumibacter petaseus NBRC 106054]
MSDFKDTISKIVAFRDARDWEQFHNAKDLALAISIEAGELNEQFLWKDAAAANREKVREELADILIYSFLLAHQQELDIASIIEEKLAANDAKYPVDKSKGSSKKYNEH